MPRTRRQQAAAAVHTKGMPPVSEQHQLAKPKATPKDHVTPAVTTAPPKKAHSTSKASPLSSLAAEKKPKHVTIDESRDETPPQYVAMLKSLSGVGLPKQGNVCKGKYNY